MVFEEIISHGFARGLGLTLEEVLDSAHFKRNLTLERMRIREAQKSPHLSLAASRHPVEVSLWLNSRSERKALDTLKKAKVHSPDWHRRALIRTFGEMLSDAAFAGLPETLHAELTQQALRWNSMSYAERVQCAQTLIDRLQFTGALRSKRSSILGHTADETLPLQFAEGRRNCVGTAQVLQGFFRKARARSFVTFPIIGAEEIAFITERHFLVTFMKLLGQGKTRSDKTLYSDFAKMLVRQAEVKNAFAYQHASMLVEMSPETWAVVDPYQIQFGLYTEASHDIGRSVALLEKYSKVVPGFMVLHSTSETERWFIDNIAIMPAKLLGLAKQLAKEVEIGAQVELVELVGLLTQENVVEEISDSFGPDTLKVDGQIGASEEAKRVAHAYSIILAIALAQGNQIEPAKILAELPSVLAFAARNTFWRKFHEQREKQMLNKLIEIGDADYQIAVATLAHLGHFFPHRQQLENALVDQSASFFRLLSLTKSRLTERREVEEKRLRWITSMLAAWPKKHQGVVPIFEKLGYYHVNPERMAKNVGEQRAA